LAVIHNVAFNVAWFREIVFPASAACPAISAGGLRLTAILSGVEGSVKSLNLFQVLIIEKYCCHLFTQKNYKHCSVDIKPTFDVIISHDRGIFDNPDVLRQL
jgi:hypothetical protein